jgi:hypothetical protein
LLICIKNDLRMGGERGFEMGGERGFDLERGEPDA